MSVADLNGADFVGLDCPPCQTLAPGSVFRAQAFVSHWDARPLRGARLRWQALAVDRFGEHQAVDEGAIAVDPPPYGVSAGGEVVLRLPDELALVTVALWLEDGAGAVRARNYVNVDVHDPAAPFASPGANGGAGAQGPVPGRPGIVVTPGRVERTRGGYALRFLPGDFADTSWVTPTIGKGGGKLGASGAGWVEYLLPLPETLDVDAVGGLRLRFEAGTRTARNRIGWKDPLYVLSTDFPQTEALKLPGDLDVSVNGVPLGRVRLPDDPADSSGVLSLHLHETFETGSYGALFTLEADAAAARRMLRREVSPGGHVTVRFEVPRRPGALRSGLSLYGARMGAYPLDPTLFLDLTPDA
jgi:hypothetical protein